ncbi:MAG: carboxylesterase family protein [Mycobacterium sp.]|nr:carboxylesterase family protein [Mycobacterium sp.]
MTVVETRYGAVGGTEQNGVRIFRGIPYGTAERFSPPMPPAAWTGVRDAVEFGPIAPQYGGQMWQEPRIGPYFCGGRQSELPSVRHGEDCLVLNVLTPRIGDPNHPQLPHWQPYLPHRDTMIFDLDSRPVRRHRDEERLTVRQALSCPIAR